MDFLGTQPSFFAFWRRYLCFSNMLFFSFALKKIPKMHVPKSKNVFCPKVLCSKCFHGAFLSPPQALHFQDSRDNPHPPPAPSRGAQPATISLKPGVSLFCFHSAEKSLLEPFPPPCGGNRRIFMSPWWGVGKIRNSFGELKSSNVFHNKCPTAGGNSHGWPFQEANGLIPVTWWLVAGYHLCANGKGCQPTPL